MRLMCWQCLVGCMLQTPQEGLTATTSQCKPHTSLLDPPLLSELPGNAYDCVVTAE